VIEDPYGDPTRWSQPTGWRESAEPGGSPGAGEGSAPTGGWQLAGDGNQDGRLDISDPVWLLLQLFTGSGGALPCEGTSPSEGGNLTLLDSNGSASVDLTDAVYVLNYLFRDGPDPVLGTACTRIPGCPQACGF
jgi:hypothetical protein